MGMLLARLTNIPRVFEIDRVTVPGGGFIRTDNQVTLSVVYLDGTTDTLTVNGDFIPTKRIARIHIPPTEKGKKFTIEVHDKPPIMTDGSNVFPIPDYNVFPMTAPPQIPVQATATTQFITNGASFSGSGWARLVLHIIGGGGGGGGGASTDASNNYGGGGGGAGGNGGVILAYYLLTNYSISCTAGTGGSGGAGVTTLTTNGNPGTAGGNSSCSITDNVTGASITLTANGGGGGGGGTSGGSGGSGGAGGSTSVSINTAFLGLILYSTINGNSGGSGGSGTGTASGNGGSVSQSPYYTYSTSNNAFTTSVSTSGGSGGNDNSAQCTAGSNASAYGAGGGGGGGGAAATATAPYYYGCAGGNGAPGAVFIGIIQEQAVVSG